MARPGKHASKKPEALKLRLTDRLGAKEISRRTGVPMSTLHYWLRDHPLSASEKSSIISRSPRYVAPKKILVQDGDLLDEDVDETLSSRAIGAMGESAAAWFLSSKGLIVAKPAFDGDVVDYYVRQPGGERVAFIQVRCSAKPPSRSGLPTFSLRRFRAGRANNFKRGDFHFLVGYCRQDGNCYVYSFDEVCANANSVTVREDAKKAIWKITEWLEGSCEAPERVAA